MYPFSLRKGHVDRKGYVPNCALIRISRTCITADVIKPIFSPAWEPHADLICNVVPTSLLMSTMSQNTGFHDITRGYMSRLNDRMIFGWLVLDLLLKQNGGD